MCIEHGSKVPLKVKESELARGPGARSELVQPVCREGEQDAVSPTSACHVGRKQYRVVVMM